MDMYKIQDLVRNNTTDMHKAVNDLTSWTTDVTVKEKKGVNKTQAPQSTKQLPPIRNKIDI